MESQPPHSLPLLVLYIRYCVLREISVAYGVGEASASQSTNSLCPPFQAIQCLWLSD